MNSVIYSLAKKLITTSKCKIPAHKYFLRCNYSTNTEQGQVSSISSSTLHVGIRINK